MQPISCLIVAALNIAFSAGLEAGYVGSSGKQWVQATMIGAHPASFHLPGPHGFSRRLGSDMGFGTRTLHRDLSLMLQPLVRGCYGRRNTMALLETIGDTEQPVSRL